MKTSKKKQIANYHKASFAAPTTPPRLSSSETKYAKRTHFGILTAKAIKKRKTQPKMVPTKPSKKKQTKHKMFGTPYHPNPIDFGAQ